LEDRGIDRRIILKYILKKQDMKAWIGFIGSGYRMLWDLVDKAMDFPVSYRAGIFLTS
jgi:hypothetical protein